MGNIKKILQNSLKDMVIIPVQEEHIRECVDNYLKSNFDIREKEYKIQKISDESDIVTITFNDENIEEKMCEESDIIENSILNELGKTQEVGTIRAFCSDPYSTEFINIMISVNLLEE